MIINLRLSWQGPYTYGQDWNISTLDIKMENSAQDISANIDSNLPPANQQDLIFSVKNKVSFFERERECGSIGCPIDLVKSMKLSARIFQIYQNRSMMIRDSSSHYNFAMHARRDNLPVSIDPFPEFEQGATYQIKIVNQNNSLRATLEKKVNDAALPKIPTMPLPAQDSELELYFMILGSLASLLATSSTPDPELAEVPTSVLQERLEAAIKKDESSKANLSNLMLSGDTTLWKEAIIEKQKTGQEVIRLTIALKARVAP